MTASSSDAPSPDSVRQRALTGRVRQALSPDRLGKFDGLSGTPSWESLANYALNVALCEAFYPLLHHAEVVLRNAIDAAVSLEYGTSGCLHIPSWLDAPATPLTDYAKKEVHAAKKKFLPWDRRTDSFNVPATSKPVKHGDLLAALDFGFWTGLLHKSYLFQSGRDRRFWPHLLRTVFPHYQGPWDRTFLGIAASELNDVRQFRNRVFHHEPIWRRTLSIDRDRLIKVISWSSPELARLVAAIERTGEVLGDDYRRRLRVRVYRETRRR